MGPAEVEEFHCFGSASAQGWFWGLYAEQKPWVETWSASAEAVDAKHVVKSVDATFDWSRLSQK